MSHAAVELQDPLRHVVEEIAIVRDGNDRAGIFGERVLQLRMLAYQVT